VKQMATKKTPQTSKLALKVQTGINAAGQPVYRTRTYANVKTGAADCDVLAVAQGLGSLQIYAVQSIGRVDDNTLADQ
jgi:hypothetical protein